MTKVMKVHDLRVGIRRAPRRPVLKASYCGH